MDTLKNIAQTVITLGMNPHIQAEVISSGLPGGSNGPGDAYRHILRSAEMYRRYPDVYASAVNDFRELVGGTTHSGMDYVNNEIGKQIGCYAQAHGLDAVQTRALVREVMQKSLAGYTPETIDSEWHPQPDGSVRSPLQSVTLSNGLHVPTPAVTPSRLWLNAQTYNWPDAEGAWLKRFSQETTEYYQPSHAADNLTEIGAMDSPATPAIPDKSIPLARGNV